MLPMLQWVVRLPEVGDDIIAKAKRVDSLRAEAAEIEAEAKRVVMDTWSLDEVSEAMGISAEGRTATAYMTRHALRVALAALGMRQRAFAARLGVAPNTVNRWLSGTVPIPRYAAALIDALLAEQRREPA